MYPTRTVTAPLARHAMAFVLAGGRGSDSSPTAALNHCVKTILRQQHIANFRIMLKETDSAQTPIVFTGQV